MIVTIEDYCLSSLLISLSSLSVVRWDVFEKITTSICLM
jgi:hypothetical protein